MRLTGHVEDPADKYRPRPGALAGITLPDLDDDHNDRQKLADAVQHAVESMDDTEDGDGDESEDF